MELIIFFFIIISDALDLLYQSGPVQSLLLARGKINELRIPILIFEMKFTWFFSHKI